MSKPPSRRREKNQDKLSEVSALIEAARKSQIMRLDLSGMGFTEVPESIGQLTQLQVLHLSNNKLTKLPDSIGQLTRLQNLYLSGNRLTEVPESIGQLTRLIALSLSNNQLAKLPESIGRLTQLRILYADHNHLINLPESLKSLISLKALFLHGNDSLNLPAEVLGTTWQEAAAQKLQMANAADIIDYYFRIRGEPRPLNEAKLILVGRGEVGKTTIVNRLVHKRFNKNEKKTEGINITAWPLTLNGDENVRLNVWDFGGQEIMHATHQFFLTQRSLYLLVLNGRMGGEEAEAEYWLKLIESFGGDSPVIVVMNKIKEHPFDVNRRALQQKYPVIRDFIKTDCEDETGIEDLRKVIERETDRLEHLRDSFPASWFSIKDKLAGMEKNYLNFDEYRDVCAGLGETDSKAQEALAFYLHSLGIALNYKDDPRLQDTHVLNPRWVTNGIYKILNSDKLEEQHGLIRLSDLPGILDTSEYPIKMHLFLLDLMKKFELCFSFPGDENYYLIPELLDKQEPLDTANFNLAECLNFQYHYPVLPEGLLPRFIVRTHAMSEGLPRWRTGVILRFESNQALVKADAQDKKVFISVSGPAASRRRLLAIIRSDFERIHHDIRNLKPEEMVPLPDYPQETVTYHELAVMEQAGVNKFTKVVGNRVLPLVVDDLLNGVDLEGTRRKQARMDERRDAVRLFYSYSHKDERLRNNLETHLKLMQRRGVIDVWHDRKIEAGEDWKQKIDQNLEQADIILLLVSADFINSDYCYEIEMKRALERHDKGEARVVPVIVRDVNWSAAPFARLQALPKDGLPVSKWRDRDSALRNVSEGIEMVVKEMRKTTRA
ncbi:MAG TPA: COR domain-containing protein [Blastocatellia bacterium]|nr:COR domain-containing protein [Blastocatellia bacterium]